MYVILDTDGLVRRYAGYDSLFKFYEDGIKDVIRDAVMHAGRKRQLYFYEEFSAMSAWGQTLAGRTTRAWETGIDMALDHSHLGVHDYQQYQAKVDREIIELVTEEIEREVNRMVHALVGEDRVRIEPADQALTPVWLGNDLVVQIEQVAEDTDGAS